MSVYKNLVLLVCCLSLAACGGGESSHAGGVHTNFLPSVTANAQPVVATSAMPRIPGASGTVAVATPISQQPVQVQLTYQLPTSANRTAPASPNVTTQSHASRSLQYISTANTKLSIAVTPIGGTTTVTGPTTCSLGSCAVSFTAMPGPTTLVFTLTDNLSTVLSTFSTTTIVQPSTLNTLNFTANPVVKSVALTLTSATENAGTPVNDLVTLTAKDADSKTIVGTSRYVDANGNALAFSLHTINSQAGGRGTVSIIGPLRITAPGQAAIYAHYDGNWLDHTDISVTVSGGTIAGTLTGTTLTTIPTSIEYGGLTPNFDPAQIVAGPDGNLWFTSDQQPRIGKMTTNGVVTEYTAGISAGPGDYVNGITVGPDGNLWFTDYDSNIVGRITTAGMVTEFSGGLSSTFRGDIVTGPDGNLWFDEDGPDAIARITTSGTVTHFSSGITNGTKPGGLCIGPDRNFWFSDGNASKIGRMTLQGQGTQFSYTDSPGMDTLGFGCTTGPDGNIWLASTSGTEILKSTVNGAITIYTAGLGGASVTYIVAGPDGNLWFTDHNGAIGRITTAGTVTEYTNGLVAGEWPYCLTRGPDGNLWFTGRQEIGKFVW